MVFVQHSRTIKNSFAGVTCTTTNTLHIDSASQFVDYFRILSHEQETYWQPEIGTPTLQVSKPKFENVPTPCRTARGKEGTRACVCLLIQSAFLAMSTKRHRSSFDTLTLNKSKAQRSPLNRDEARGQPWSRSRTSAFHKASFPLQAQASALLCQFCEQSVVSMHQKHVSHFEFSESHSARQCGWAIECLRHVCAPAKFKSCASVAFSFPCVMSLNLFGRRILTRRGKRGPFCRRPRDEVITWQLTSKGLLPVWNDAKKRAEGNSKIQFRI